MNKVGEYEFSPFVLLRSPSLSYEDYQLEKSILFGSDFFKTAIYLASRDLFSVVNKKGFDFHALNSKEKTTLLKYLNRACYRPTPFGIFSSFSLLNWSSEINSVTLSRKGTLSVHLDFEISSNLSAVLASETVDDCLYFVNRSLYRVDREYRYFRYHKNDNSSKLQFELDALAYSQTIEKVLKFCRIGKRKREIIQFITMQTACSEDEAFNHFFMLTDHQILSSALGSTITGGENVNRVLASMPFAKPSQAVQETRYLLDILSFLNFPALSDILTISERIERSFPDILGSSSLLYAGYSKKVVKGGLSNDFCARLTDALSVVDLLLSQAPVNNLMGSFIKEFNRKFEGQTMPLLVVLDPEIGINYGGLTTVRSDDHLFEREYGEASAEKKESAEWHEIQKILFRLWLKSGNQKNSVIRLEDANLSSLVRDPKDKGPAGINLLFRVFSDKLFLEQAGGSTSNALIARFGVFDESVKILASELADREQIFNKDVIFAEIAHIDDLHVDNINRREHSRNFEIPLLCQSALVLENQIPLTDLYIAVVGEEVILYSKSQKKRVIPRLSTAYNYQRSSFAIYKFLGDIQHQNIRSRFDINLSSVFPGMEFYPRVQYKEVILSLAKWEVNAKDLQIFSGLPENEILTVFGQFKMLLQLPRYFALIEHDNFLVFDTRAEDDVILFSQIVKGKDKVTLQEYLTSGERDDLVHDELGKPFVNQFIAFLTKTKETYPGISLSTTDREISSRKQVPGSDWTYLKIYCHQNKANEILVRNIMPALKHCLEKDSLWFFIRYGDPEFHIRLRINSPQQTGAAVVERISRSLKKALRCGVVDRISTDTYQRELERYGPENMEKAEWLFHQSSRLVVAYIARISKLSDSKYHSLAIISTNALLRCFLSEEKQILGFLEDRCAIFFQEFKEIDNLKFKLDKEFRKRRKEMEGLADDNSYFKKLRLTKTYSDFLSETRCFAVTLNPLIKEQFLADIIHMHLNRLFIEDARLQELAVYYFLLKINITQAKKAKD